LFQRLFENIGSFIECRSVLPVSLGIVNFIDKHLRLMAELATAAQLAAPVAFLPYLTPFTEMMFNHVQTLAPPSQLGDASGVAPIAFSDCEAFVVACLLFLRNVLQCSEYSEKKNRQAYELRRSYFTKERSVSLVRTLALLLRKPKSARTHCRSRATNQPIPL
jgi:hypothetical protein